MTQTQTAKDAVLNINGLDVSSTSNTINSALKGVTFNLQQAQVGKTVTINVNRQSEELTTAINSFVEKYNALVANVKSSTSYDATTKTAGILMGESVVQSGMVQIRSMLTNSLNSASGISTLSDVGISIQKDGSLKFDADKFAKAQNTDIDSVTALFSVLGRTSDSKVQYISSSKETMAGSYAVNITQAATQASLETSALSFPLTVDGTNNSLVVKVNGLKSGTIALTQKNL
ncbi:flagellar filament capping protein FliD [Methylocucumis oryzae]|uniref:Flagellar hook-associated protein 2 C-terminal domain-containing protein n=1 Tax=Methylocucumis oryzae TaxID=1632867 RepID=A0A0F3IGM1_9GAMM|nr:flagellar filament capping protein FliD [Methylocucumis oryzae]KJV05950.1 hypothetical protein VZ94_14525 [Methylocucumis oryzae]